MRVAGAGRSERSGAPGRDGRAGRSRAAKSPRGSRARAGGDSPRGARSGVNSPRGARVRDSPPGALSRGAWNSLRGARSRTGASARGARSRWNSPRGAASRAAGAPRGARSRSGENSPRGAVARARGNSPRGGPSPRGVRSGRRVRVTFPCRSEAAGRSARSSLRPPACRDGRSRAPSPGAPSRGGALRRGRSPPSELLVEGGRWLVPAGRLGGPDRLGGRDIRPPLAHAARTQALIAQFRCGRRRGSRSPPRSGPLRTPACRWRGHAAMTGAVPGLSGRRGRGRSGGRSRRRSAR